MTKKYIGLSALQTFLDNLKTLFATKTEVNNKAELSHTHNDLYYTKAEIDSYEFITTDDIDAICTTT